MNSRSTSARTTTSASRSTKNPIRVRPPASFRTNRDTITAPGSVPNPFFKINSINLMILMLQDGCSEIVLASDKPFRRLDHYKMHEYSSRSHCQQGSLSSPKEIHSASASAFSLDSMFRRKRGRPPKNRIIEVWNESVS